MVRVERYRLDARTGGSDPIARSLFRSSCSISEPANSQVPSQTLEENQQKQIDSQIEDTISMIKSLLQNDDFTVRRFRIFGQYCSRLALFSSLNNKTMLNDDVLNPLMQVPSQLQNQQLSAEDLKNVLQNDILHHAESQLEHETARLIDSLLRGESVVVVDGWEEALVIGTRNVDRASGARIA